MEKNNKIVIMSIVIALIALLIIILSLSFIVLTQTTKKAHVENLIDPLASFGDSNYGGSIINIFDGDADGDDDDEDEEISGNPNIQGLPDIYFDEDTFHDTLDLDNYVTDGNHSLSELIWNVTGNTNITITIDNSTHMVNFSAPANWSGAENVTFNVTDPDGLYDEETILVTVLPVDDPTVWNVLSDQNTDEDSPDDTVIYANITSEVIDPDSTTNITVVSSHSDFEVEVTGNDLMIVDLTANWYGSEVVVLECNGAYASFTLTVNHLLDDCVEICSWGTCYKLCD